MSQENVEIVKRLWNAFNRADITALGEICTEDFEFISVLTDVDAATYRGPETWTLYFERMAETWDAWQVEDVRIFDAGGSRVVAIARLVGTGKSSGAQVEQEIGLDYTLRSGKLWRLRSYRDSAKALEAAGLSE